jgi:hypothetical protein
LSKEFGQHSAKNPSFVGPLNDTKDLFVVDPSNASVPTVHGYAFTRSHLSSYLPGSSGIPCANGGFSSKNNSEALSQEMDCIGYGLVVFLGNKSMNAEHPSVQLLTGSPSSRTSLAKQREEKRVIFDIPEKSSFPPLDPKFEERDAFKDIKVAFS